MSENAGVPLRVVSYNIHSQRDDAAALAAVVREAAPDVVIVQEAPGGSGGGRSRPRWPGRSGWSSPPAGCRRWATCC